MKIVFLGERGAGKTSILRAFEHAASHNWFVFQRQKIRSFVCDGRQQEKRREEKGREKDREPTKQKKINSSPAFSSLCLSLCLSV